MCKTHTKSFCFNRIGKEIGVSPETILKTSHGRRSIDVLKILAPERANWECMLSYSNPLFKKGNYQHLFNLDVAKVEGQLPHLYGDDATEIPGARSLLDALISVKAPWAIVTSGTEPLVSGWLNVLKLAIPEHLVTAESVAEGKPDPACYRMGLDKLALGTGSGAITAADVLVLEDSPAGIKAGKDAGCRVIGLVTSHTVEQVAAAEPDWIVRDLDSVKVVASEGGKITLEIANGLRQGL
jgi:glycerol 3-phosphatase-1